MTILNLTFFWFKLSNKVVIFVHITEINHIYANTKDLEYCVNIIPVFALVRKMHIILSMSPSLDDVDKLTRAIW